jgi:guanylate kinase
VVARLRAQRPDIWLSVSVTTRSPRPGEVNGREYHFVSDEAFDAMVARGELLEWATFAGRKYGTPKAPVEERAAAGVPSREELARRLTGRGTEPPEVIVQRLDMARQEIEAGREFDITLVNTSVKDVCNQLVTLMTA